MKKAEDYADIILRDEREKIVRETPTVFETDKIERVYEFADGARVTYEWQQRNSNAEHFNHRFSLTDPPQPNPHKFEKGIIKVINYRQR